MSKIVETSAPQDHELTYEWDDGALVFTDENGSIYVSIRCDPTYGYWSVTGTVEGEFATLQEAKDFINLNLYSKL